jgi:hypothetical protein
MISSDEHSLGHYFWTRAEDVPTTNDGIFDVKSKEGRAFYSRKG